MINHSESSIGLVLQRIKDDPCICSGCGKAHGTSVHSTDTVIVEDLPISGKRVFLHVPKRRALCLEDDRIRTEELQWLRGRVTRRFAEHVYRLTSITTNTEAGWFLGLDDEKVYRVDRGMLEELSLQRLDKIPAPRYMSVDEVAWQKWHKYVTNVVDIEKRQVIWNCNGRGKTTLDAFYRKLGKKDCRKIEAVASDGARGFLSSTKEHLENAVIVLDHFHVKKYLNDAVDAVRKEELRKARQQKQGELADVLHCNKRFILMQNTVSDKKRNLLERLSSLNKRVYKAMLLKEQFLTIYQAGDRKAAYANLRQWIVAAVKSGMPSFAELGYKFFRKRHYVLNYFICKITTAISEGINNKIKRLKRMAYGYRDVKYFLLKIHQHCGLLSPRLST
ncbi:MAG: ISL3 family transposase [Nitrospiraceae bacterium]|nr:ISL3 family transposase [Nitrospiraceae bacterium]